MRDNESEVGMRQWLGVLLICLATAPSGISSAAEGEVSGEAEASRILARVNQVEITHAQFESRLQTLQQERGPIRPEQFVEVLRGMVQEEILFQAAAAAGLEQVAAVKARLEQARRQVLIGEFLRRKIVEPSRVTEEEARKMYEDNKPLFSTETVAARHIMVKTQAEAEAILQDLQAGKDFADLAKTKSQDTGSAEKGGELGALKRGQTVSEFEEEAFRLKEGELSPVIKTQYGFHILKGGAHTTVVQPFEEVKDRLRQSLLQQKQQDTFTVFMADLEKKAKMEIHEDRLR
jgi:peptidyl-prolyl cis-trans isomerase C